jgi:hypothetical protein
LQSEQSVDRAKSRSYPKRLEQCQAANPPEKLAQEQPYLKEEKCGYLQQTKLLRKLKAPSRALRIVEESS